jgi:ribose-phosphate pyrophosphokinase
MISTGGTAEATVKALLAAGCVPEVGVLTSHALLVGPAAERLRALTLRWLPETKSVDPPAGVPLPLRVAGLGPLLAEAVQRLHCCQSLDDLIVHV